MEKEICRLCLGENNLSPIFEDESNSVRFTDVLGLTTGLKIELNDGLPQKICEDCTGLVNSALNLRNQSHCSEMKLLAEVERRQVENNTENQLKIEDNKDENENNDRSSDDCYDFDGFKIEIELDRLSQDNGGELKNKNAKAKPSIQPKNKKDADNMTLQQKREMYMTYVDGKFDPKQPIKCKTCKQILKNWACFINHVKKHLGWKFIICEFCGKSLLSSQLKRHCRSYHGLQREHKCSHCDYLALDKTQLLLHERRQHTGERPYVCDVCAASYFSRKCLLQHLEHHRTTASVKCDICGQLLKSFRHLARHRYSRHGDRARERKRERRKMARARENVT